MLSDHYAFAIEDLRRHGPRPADVEWRAAQADCNPNEHAPPAIAAHDGARPQPRLLVVLRPQADLSEIVVAVREVTVCC
ncbi:MAG: hypothetical protein WBQ21_06145 [Solirubrobacteraceae bacterium]